MFLESIRAFWRKPRHFANENPNPAPAGPTPSVQTKAPVEREPLPTPAPPAQAGGQVVNINVTACSTVHPQPGDVVIVKCNDLPSEEVAVQMLEIIKQMFPRNNVLVLHGSTSLRVQSSGRQN